jgi:hypothetical protein
MLCVHTENAQLNELAVAARPKGFCKDEVYQFIEVPFLDENGDQQWAPAGFCRMHIAQRAILKYLSGITPNRFTEDEIEFLASCGYNKNGIVFKA